jgi:hypothetical protein
MPLDLGGISGDFTNFSSTNAALRAVKGTAEGNESLVGFTRHRSKFLFTKSTVLHCVENHLEAPTPLDRGGSSGDLTNFSSTNGALRVVKGAEEDSASHLGHARYCGKSSVTTNTMLHRVELT